MAHLPYRLDRVAFFYLSLNQHRRDDIDSYPAVLYLFSPSPCRGRQGEGVVRMTGLAPSRRLAGAPPVVLSVCVPVGKFRITKGTSEIRSENLNPVSGDFTLFRSNSIFY